MKSYKGYKIKITSRIPELDKLPSDFVRINCVSKSDSVQFQMQTTYKYPENKKELLEIIKILIDERITHNEKISTCI